MQISGSESPAKVFHGVRFVLCGFDPIKEHKIRSKLLDGGAIDAAGYGPDCSHVIVDKLVYNDTICVAARRDGKTLVTSLWVENSFNSEMLADPTSVMYLPVRDWNGIPGAKGLVMCLTGYQGHWRDDVKNMVGLMGASFSKPLVATKVTHLICYKFEGEKYELAKKMNIKLVNHRWLEDCLKAWKIVPEAEYSKSGYELLMEAEAKDSEDDASKTDMERNNIFYPQTTCAENKSHHQSSAKLDDSRKSLSLSASKNSANVRNSSKIPLISGEKINFENTSLPQEAQNKHLEMAGFSSARSPGNTPSKHLEMAGICNARSPGNMSSDMRTIPGQEIDFEEASVSREAHHNHLKLPGSVGTRSPRNMSFDVPSNTRYDTAASDKVEYALTSASGSATKSSNGQVLKSSGKMPSTSRTRSPGTKFPDGPPSTRDSMAVSEKVEHILVSASKSAKKSPTSELSKLGSKSYYRSPPRKSDLPLRIEPYSGSPSASNVSKHTISGGFDMSLERLHDECDAGVKTPATGTSSLLDNGKTASNKRKTPVSHGKAKSPLSIHEPKNSLGSKLVAKTPELLAPRSSIDGSHASAVDVCPKNVACHSEDEVPCVSKEAANISVTTEDRQKCNNQVLQCSTEGLEKRTSTNSDLKGHSSNRTDHLIAEVEMRQSDESALPGANPCVEKMNGQADLNHSKAGQRGSQLKAARKEKMFAKKLGSRPTTFKTAKRKGSIKLQKAVLQNECITHSNETIGTEDTHNNIVSEKVEKVRAAAHEDCSAGTETKAPDDSRQNECNAGHNKSEAAEVKASHLGEGVVHKKSLDDQEVLQTKEPVTKSVGEVSIRAAEKAVCSGRTELTELNPIGEAEKKKDTKGKKRPLTKSKTNKSKDPEQEEKKSEPTSKHDEKKAVSRDEEETVSLAGKTKTSIRKAKNSDDVEKENKPVMVQQKSVRNEVSGEVGSLPHKKTPLRGESKANKASTNSSERVQKLEVKTEPASWFILSGHRLQRKEFQKVIRQLKGRVCRDSHNWSYQATHFIAPDPIRRTEKFFAAVASGSWILKTDYLIASNEAGRFLSEETYEWHKKGLSEDGAINLEAPRKWRLLKKRTGHGAFYGMKIVVYGECIAPPLDTLKRVVKAGDGTILATSPPYTRFLKSGIDFAIISAGMPHGDIWVQEFLRNQVPCVVADYLVDHVCKPGYSLEKHVQYNTHTWAQKSLKNLITRVEQEDDAEDDVHTPDNHGIIEDVACQVCERRDRGEDMLICGDENGIEGCGIGMHIDCLDPPLNDIPEEDWFCPSCSRKREESMAKRQTPRKKGSQGNKRPKGNKH